MKVFSLPLLLRLPFSAPLLLFASSKDDAPLHVSGLIQFNLIFVQFNLISFHLVLIFFSISPVSL